MGVARPCWASCGRSDSSTGGRRSAWRRARCTTSCARIHVITNYNADIYDVMHPGSLQGDIEWYCEKAVASRGPVLELGAGTGRIALAVAEAASVFGRRPRGACSKNFAKIAALPTGAARISVHHATCVLELKSSRWSDPVRVSPHSTGTTSCRRSVRTSIPARESWRSMFSPSLEFMAANSGSSTGVCAPRHPETRAAGSSCIRTPADDTVLHA